MDKQKAIRMAVDCAGGGLTDLAKDLGVANPAISIWLAGRRPVPLKQAVKIEQLYGVLAEHLCPEYKDVIYYLRGTGDGECKTSRVSGRRTRTK